jgi:DNA polymerase-3 subunit delta'
MNNKLLKLIEEPPANTLFILVDENEDLILPTIISRCQLVKIPQLSVRDLELALIERSGVSATQARQIAAISDGSYREALQQLQHTGSDWEENLREWLNCIVKKDLIAQVKWVEDMSKGGRERQKQFLRYFNHLLEQSIRLRIMGIVDERTGNGAYMSDKELDFAERLNKLIEIPQQQAIIEDLDRASYYIERNANAKMLFHALTIKLFHIISKKQVIFTW